MSNEKCQACGAERAVQKQGPDCTPGYGRRSRYQCTTCGNVTGMQEHPCGDRGCRIHHSAWRRRQGGWVGSSACPANGASRAGV